MDLMSHLNSVASGVFTGQIYVNMSKYWCMYLSTIRLVRRCGLSYAWVADINDGVGLE